MLFNDLKTPLRQLRLIEIFARQRSGLTFSELQAMTDGAAPTTLTRLLKPLLETRYLEKGEGGRYFAGEQLKSLGRIVCQRANLDDLLVPLVKELAVRSGCSAAFFIWDGQWPAVRIKHELSDNFHYAKIGYRIHPNTHTFVQSIFAHLSLEDLNSVGGEISKSLKQKTAAAGYNSQQETTSFAFFRVTAPVFAGVPARVIGRLGITSLNPEPDPKYRQFLATCVKGVAEAATLACENLKESDVRVAFEA